MHFRTAPIASSGTVFPASCGAHPPACRRRTTVVFRHSVGRPGFRLAFPDVRGDLIKWPENCQPRQCVINR